MNDLSLDISMYWIQAYMSTAQPEESCIESLLYSGCTIQVLDNKQLGL